ncbi:PASTA domain-containing protein [Ilyobacter sp.]|jgi:serine/threonine-protein kinase|uniref:PASTA domain-containing protein n=1 Tax=Ilyobacter sp. TaxID=3100343 RepID=UPI0035631C42
MNKRGFYISSGLMLIAILFFSGSIFIKFYFNEFLIVTPDLANFSVAEAEKIFSKNSIEIKKMGEDYSQYDKDKIFSQKPEPGEVIKKGRVIRVWTSRGQDKIIVPDFNGMDLSDAKASAERLGLIVKNISYAQKNAVYNQVISSDPGAGSIVYRNKEVSFLVDMKKIGAKVRMPDLIGVDLSTGKRMLKSKNLIVGKIDYIQNSELESGIIVDSGIQPGIMTFEGTVVDIIINK